MKNKISDREYRMNYQKLYHFLAGSDPSKISRVVLVGSRPPTNGAVWNHAKQARLEVMLADRNADNREKKIDTWIVAAMMRDAYKFASEDDVFTLVAGDGDYVPAIKQLIGDGFRVNVVF